MREGAIMKGRNGREVVILCQQCQIEVGTPLLVMHPGKCRSLEVPNFKTAGSDSNMRQ